MASCHPLIYYDVTDDIQNGRTTTVNKSVKLLFLILRFIVGRRPSPPTIQSIEMKRTKYKWHIDGLFNEINEITQRKYNWRSVLMWNGVVNSEMV